MLKEKIEKQRIKLKHFGFSATRSLSWNAEGRKQKVKCEYEVFCGFYDPESAVEGGRKKSDRSCEGWK